MTGTPNQISWAELIKVQVAEEFDRVSRALSERGRGDMAGIVDEHRRQVLANDFAGYFIREWGEMNGQVRRMVTADPKYTALRPPANL